MSVSVAESLAWTDQGMMLFTGAAAGLNDGELDAATLLPDWSRRHLLAHVAANAEALGNLVYWAATGDERPMYASPEQRNADIESGAGKSPAELRAWVERSAGELRQGLDALTDRQWQHRVRTAQGRVVAATEIPWMRAREAMVHAVDLNAGVGFADLPDSFLTTLVDDIVGKRSRSGDGPALTIRADDTKAAWQVAGTGDPVSCHGRLAELAGWLSGRRNTGVLTDGGALPDLPRWL